MQALAQRQPDAIAVFRAASQNQPTRALKRRNKSQQKDGCVGTLSLKEAVGSVAVGSTRIFVYDTARGSPGHKWGY